MKQKGFAPIIILVLIALAVVGYFGYKYFKSTNQQVGQLSISSPTPSSIPTASPPGFSYNCPSGWISGKNLNYGGKVETVECSLTYAGRYSFDDGGMFTLGFVPNSLPRDLLTYSNGQIETLKGFANTAVYSKNGFDGWISMKNESHTLLLMARKYVAGGYYDATALAMGDTKTDQEYKEIFDQILSTFKFISATPSAVPSTIPIPVSTSSGIPSGY